jgi:hypothetical protein
MRKIFLAAVAATAIMLGATGTGFAATPPAGALTVRQDVTPDVFIVESPSIRCSLTGDPNLSNDQDDGD